jgi:hypothetical protein
MRGVKGSSPTQCSISDEECSPPGGQIRCGWCMAHYWRKRRNGDPFTVLPPNGGGPKPQGIGSPNWKGDDIDYSGAHKRLRRDRGPASDYICPCGRQARDWAYSNVCQDEKQSDFGPYCVHIDCYEPLCVSCHRVKDNAHERMAS